MNGPTIDMHNDPLRYRDGNLQEASLVPAIPTNRALPGVNIDEIQSRSDLLKELTKHIPLNEFGLPQYYYRPDMLDVGMITGSMRRGENTFVEETLQAAIVQIWYTQGFPSIGDDVPLWGRLPYESKEAHDAFLAYCELEGVRGLHLLQAFEPVLLREYYHLYYWASRAKAFDVFRSTHHARLREQRIMKLEDSHWLEGEKIFKRIVQAIGNKTPEELQALDVDKLINSLEKVSKIQRSAVRADAKNIEDVPKQTSVEVVMRQIADAQGHTIDSDTLDLSLLEDPEVLKQAQELIIRVNK